MKHILRLTEATEGASNSKNGLKGASYPHELPYPVAIKMLYVALSGRVETGRLQLKCPSVYTCLVFLMCLAGWPADPLERLANNTCKKLVEVIYFAVDMSTPCSVKEPTDFEDRFARICALWDHVQAGTRWTASDWCTAYYSMRGVEKVMAWEYDSEKFKTFFIARMFDPRTQSMMAQTGRVPMGLPMQPSMPLAPPALQTTMFVPTPTRVKQPSSTSGPQQHGAQQQQMMRPQQQHMPPQQALTQQQMFLQMQQMFQQQMMRQPMAAGPHDVLALQDGSAVPAAISPGLCPPGSVASTPAVFAAPAVAPGLAPPTSAQGIPLPPPTLDVSVAQNAPQTAMVPAFAPTVPSVEQPSPSVFGATMITPQLQEPTTAPGARAPQSTQSDPKMHEKPVQHASFAEALAQFQARVQENSIREAAVPASAVLVDKQVEESIGGDSFGNLSSILSEGNGGIDDVEQQPTAGPVKTEVSVAGKKTRVAIQQNSAFKTPVRTVKKVKKEKEGKKKAGMKKQKKPLSEVAQKNGLPTPLKGSEAPTSSFATRLFAREAKLNSNPEEEYPAHVEAEPASSSSGAAASSSSGGHNRTDVPRV